MYKKLQATRIDLKQGVVYKSRCFRKAKNRDPDLTKSTSGLRARKAFTLLELMVVFAAIGLIASIVFVSMKTARDKSKDSKRKQDLKQLATALSLYYADNNQYPTGLDMSAIESQLVPDYVPKLSQDPANVDYTWRDNTSSNQALVICSQELNTQSGNIYFIDESGNVRKTISACTDLVVGGTSGVGSEGGGAGSGQTAYNPSNVDFDAATYNAKTVVDTSGTANPGEINDSGGHDMFTFTAASLYTIWVDVGTLSDAQISLWNDKEATSQIVAATSAGCTEQSAAEACIASQSLSSGAVYVKVEGSPTTETGTYNVYVEKISGMAGSDKYAWSELMGWIDLSNVTVSNTQLRGTMRLYDSSTDDYDTIVLNCADEPSSGNDCSGTAGNPIYSVTNTTGGQVGGFAWSDTLGWVSFNSADCDDDGDTYIDTACGGENDPTTPMSGYGTHSVTIDTSTGVFTGWAWSSIAGWISFNCQDAIDVNEMNTTQCDATNPTPGQYFKVVTDWRGS